MKALSLAALSLSFSILCSLPVSAETVRVSPPLQSTDEMKAIAPEFAKLTDTVLFGDIWKRPPLSQRDKSLVTVTVLLSLNRIEQLEAHLNKALDNGVTKDELVGAITHVAFYAGWPAAASGLTHLKKVTDERKINK